MGILLIWYVIGIIGVLYQIRNIKISDLFEFVAICIIILIMGITGILTWLININITFED